MAKKEQDEQKKPRHRNPNGVGCYYRVNDLFCWKYVRDGKPVYRSSKTEKGLQEKVRKVLNTGVSNDKTRVKDYFENWLENIIKPLKKDATYQQYYYMYHGHIKPVLGGYLMRSITTSDIQKVIIEMNKKGMATKTMKHAKTVMNQAFTRAHKVDKIIPENPVHDIQIPIKQPKQKKILSIEELGIYFKSLMRSRWIWSAKFDLVTGVRRGELLALKWTDIDWDNNRIVIDESNSSTGLGDTKSAKVHYVPLSNIAKSILINQMDMLKREMNPIFLNEDNTFRHDLKGTDLLVFPTEKGTMIKPNTYYHTIKRFAEKAGLDVHPHMFRHTWVYNMRKKLSLKEIQEALGHDETTTTLDIYGAMINDTIDSTASQIDEVFSSIEVKIEEARADIENKDFKLIDFNARRKAK
jgi:integrase